MSKSLHAALLVIIVGLAGLISSSYGVNRAQAAVLSVHSATVASPSTMPHQSNPEQECSGDGIYLYEESDYQGRCHRFVADHPNFQEFEFDNVASSIRFVGSFQPYFYRAIICEDVNIGGTCSPFMTDDPNFGDNYIKHDHASSIRIENINYGESLRIATFNVQFLPQFAVIPETHDGCCEDIPNRPRKIAELILAGDYDIIALNEAFTDEIQEGLTDAIKEYYPYYIQKVHDGDLGHQDSGLMLLSRFPFVGLSTSAYKAEHLIAKNGIGNSWDGVAYREYANESFLCYTCAPFSDSTGHIVNPPYPVDACGGSDCLSDKGIVFVRIQNPRSQQIYNIAFTHLNAASGPAASWEIRQAQFGVVEKVIKSQLPDNGFLKEHLFFLGDLNTNGNYLSNDEHWKQVFNTSGSFFTDVLSDIWHFSHIWGLDNAWHVDPSKLPPHLSNFRDPGYTSDTTKPYGTSSRIDYILYNYPNVPADKRLCIQHQTVAFNLRHLMPGEPPVPAVFASAGSHYITDHQGVNADVNLWAPRCSPDEAYANPPFDQAIEGKITYAGSMQWYRIDPFTSADFAQNGTHSIYLESDSQVDFQVFESGHMSSPLPRSGSRSESSTWTFTVPQQPFYVRVFAHDRRLSDVNYRLFIHRHEGRYQDEAIGLQPNTPYAVNSTVPVDEQRPVWFRIDTEAPDSGEAQALEFYVHGDPDASIELRDKDGVTLATGTGSIVPGPDTARTFNNQSPLYMLVTFRSKTTASVGWSTNLKIFRGTLEQPLTLQAKNATEGGFGEDDDIETLKITADGRRVVDTGGLDDFDDGQIRGLGDKVSTVKFTDTLEFDLVEHDSWPDEDDHLLGVLSPPPVLVSTIHTTTVLSRVLEFPGTPPVRVVNDYHLNSTVSPSSVPAFVSEPFITDLAADLVVPITSFVAGATLSYDFRLRNIGPGRATGVALAIALPYGVTLAPGQPNCQEKSGVATCSVGTLASTAEVSVPIRLSVDPTIEEGTVLSVSVRIDMDQPDLTPGEENPASTVEIVRRSDLSVSQSMLSGPVQAGMPSTYAIVVANHGDSIATNVLLTDTLPTGFVFDPQLSSTGCTAASGVVTCEVGLVLDSETKAVTIAGHTVGPITEGVTVINTVVVRGDEVDPNPENNSSELIVIADNRLYMPLVVRNNSVDLIVKSIVVSPEGVRVTIQNIGDTPAPVDSGLWVDLYINPSSAPSGVNQIWPEVAPFGLVWSRVLANAQLPPGADITLRVNDGYYLASHSSYPDILPTGSVIYAQVDSANANTNYGAVLEGHELRGESYNNITSVTLAEPVSTANWQALAPSNVGENETFMIEVPRD